MSKRRSPIRSVLAERRMFANGGLLATDQGQNKAAGILASSAPMIEAVSQEILAPMTGGAMPMAQGGVAKFQQGGIGKLPQGLETLPIDTLTPTQTIDTRGYRQAAYDPNNPVSMSIGDVVGQTASETANRIFPLYGSTSATFREALGPHFEQKSLEGDPYSRAEEAASEVLWYSRAAAQKAIGSVSEGAEAIFKFVFSRQSRTQGNLLNVSMIEDLIDIRPELKQDILDMAKSIVAANPGIGPETLRNTIAQEISQKLEVDPAREQNMGYFMAAEDVGLTFSEEELDFKRQTTQDLGSDEPQYEQAVVVEAEKMRMARAKGPEAYRDYMVEFSKNPSDTFIRDVQASVGDFGGSLPSYVPIKPDTFHPVQAEGDAARGVAETLIQEAQEVTPAPEIVMTEEDVTDVTDGGPVPTVADVAETGAAFWDPAGPGPWMGPGEDPSERKEVIALTPEEAPKPNPSVIAVIEAANTDNQEDVNTNIQTYIDEFKRTIPDYEGKSEYEKGMDIVKMAAAIMAGQSQYAITNIAKGVLATIDNFTSDDKERRAYKRQVDLSAAKYGLQNVAKDREELRADAKAGRMLHNEVFRVLPGRTLERHGKTLEGGDTVILTVGEIQDGSVDLGNLETEASVLKGLELYRLRLKDQLDALQKTVTDPSKFEGPKKNYLENAAGVRTNIATQGYLNNALVALNSTDVIGLKGAAKDWILRLSNSLGLKEFSEETFGKLTTKAEYVDFTERATTKFIEGLISEGGKISDFERDLARELSGAIGGGAFDGTMTDPSILQTKILSFIASLDANTDIRLKSMGLTERTWGTRYATTDPDRVSYGQMLQETRGPLSSGRLSSQMIPGSVNWTDIISVDPESNAVLGLKPRDEW